jgi:hypothetical protein
VQTNFVSKKLESKKIMNKKISKPGRRVFENALWGFGLATLLTACGGGGGGTVSSGSSKGGGVPLAASVSLANLCASPRTNTAYKPSTLEQEKSYLRSFEDETYLWYKDVPTNLVASNYSTSQTYFDALKTPARTASGNLVDQFHWFEDQCRSIGRLVNHGIRVYTV